MFAAISYSFQFILSTVILYTKTLTRAPLINRETPWIGGMHLPGQSTTARADHLLRHQRITDLTADFVLLDCNLLYKNVKRTRQFRIQAISPLFSGILYAGNCQNDKLPWHIIRRGVNSRIFTHWVLKVTNVYFVLLILIGNCKSYCITFVVFTSL